jgi:two-component system, NtrC family, sensor kinase
VETAAKLCGADKASIRRVEGGMLHHVANYGYTPEQQAYFEARPLEPGRTTMTARVALELSTVHVPDVLADPEHERPDFVKMNDTRSGVAVPLLRERELIGVLVLLRVAQRPFTDRQIELLETFADQAVIAIENTRLFEAEQARTRELAESLEQQTATAEVLKVISGSPGQLEPVFQAMLANAVRICEAKFGTLFRYDEGAFRAVAFFGVPHAFVEYQQRRGSFRPEELTSRSILSRLWQTKDVSHIADTSGFLTQGRRSDTAALSRS